MLQTDFQSDGITYKQNDSTFLIDRSPGFLKFYSNLKDYFEHILNYLRHKKIYLKEFDSKEVFHLKFKTSGNHRRVKLLPFKRPNSIH
jgi:hypothetical protein